MANKRNLKKCINFICDNIIAECIAIALYCRENKKIEAIDDNISSILRIHNDFISRISHPEPGLSQKKYYAHLKKDFTKHINEIIDNIQNL